MAVLSDDLLKAFWFTLTDKFSDHGFQNLPEEKSNVDRVFPARCTTTPLSLILLFHVERNPLMRPNRNLGVGEKKVKSWWYHIREKHYSWTFLVVGDAQNKCWH